jgi:uncharacterized protein YpmB
VVVEVFEHKGSVYSISGHNGSKEFIVAVGKKLPNGRIYVKDIKTVCADDIKEVIELIKTGKWERFNSLIGRGTE